MKTTLLATLAIAIASVLAQDKAPTAQPPLHTFPGVSDTILPPSGATLPTTLGTEVKATGSDLSATIGSPTATGAETTGTGTGAAASTTGTATGTAASASGSGTAAGTSSSSGLAVPTGHPNVIPAIGLAAALLVL